MRNQTQYPVKALGDLNKVTLLTYSKYKVVFNQLSFTPLDSTL
jgi:hypothetical protein